LNDIHQSNCKKAISCGSEQGYMLKLVFLSILQVKWAIFFCGSFSLNLHKYLFCEKRYLELRVSFPQLWSSQLLSHKTGESSCPLKYPACDSQSVRPK